MKSPHPYFGIDFEAEQARKNIATHKLLNTHKSLLVIKFTIGACEFIWVWEEEKQE